MLNTEIFLIKPICNFLYFFFHRIIKVIQLTNWLAQRCFYTVLIVLDLMYYCRNYKSEKVESLLTTDNFY